MADVKKDQERDELFRRIYKIATDLVHAGHVAEWDFKSYVLGTMFYRYISENFTAYINEGEHAAGNKDFDYAKMPDAEAETAREGLVQEKGFFILPSELFCNVLARADKDDNLNETLERVFNHIESSAASGDAENDFAGLFDDFDVNSKAIGETVAKRNKVLVELLNGVAQMCSIISTGNMHSIKEPTEFILQQTGFWENICTTTLLPLSQNISVSKCIKGQCRQSADRCSISSKWQFRHLMFKAVLSMFSTTSMPSAPTFPPASPQRSKPDRNNTNTTGTSYCHLRKRYDRTSSKRDRTMSEKRSSDRSADNGTDIAGYLRKSVPSTIER